MIAKLVEYNGELRTVAEIAEQHGLDVGILRNRVFKLSWEINKAIKEPVLLRISKTIRGKRNIKVVCRRLKMDFKNNIPYYFNIPDPHKTKNTFTYIKRQETRLQQLKAHLGPLYNEYVSYGLRAV
jgi:hypothetical protein